jgi:hypothetical protein
MGLGDQLTTVDFFNGLTEVDKIRGESFNYHICYPKMLDCRKGGYSDFCKQLFYKTYAANSNVYMNWGTGHKVKQWGAGRGMNDMAFTIFETRRGIQKLIERQNSWEQCFNYIKYKPFPQLICNNRAYKTNKRYVVLTTRVRVSGPHKTGDWRLATRFFNYVEPLLNILNDKYDEIVIIGEPTVNLWGGKTKKLGVGSFKSDPPFPNLYEAIMETLEKNPNIKRKIKDLTNPVFNIDTFLNENSICRDADKVVCFGHGGNYTRQLYIGSNLSCLMTSPNSGWDHPCVKKLLQFKETENHLENVNIFHEKNIEKFYQSL